MIEDMTIRGRRSLRDPALASGIGQFGALQAVAPSLGVELSPVDARDAPEMSAPLRLQAYKPRVERQEMGLTTGQISRSATRFLLLRIFYQIRD
jgi:hypothetical protein